MGRVCVRYYDISKCECIYINIILFGESYIKRNTLITHRLKNVILGASAYPQLKKNLKVEESLSEKYYAISTSILV